MYDSQRRKGNEQRLEEKSDKWKKREKKEKLKLKVGMRSHQWHHSFFLTDLGTRI